jgi:ketosteroid isomerase-like protein
VIRAALERWQKGEWEPRKTDIHPDVEADDGRWLAVGRLRAHGRKAGTELDRPAAWLFSLRDGRIVRVVPFPGRVDEAYAAAGLERESPA